MSTANLQVGSINVNIEVEITEYNEATKTTIPVDISSASTIKITVKRPDNTIIEKSASLTSDGTDGKMYFLTVANDLNMEGTYRIQGYVVMAGWDGSSSIGEFEVDDNLV